MFYFCLSVDTKEMRPSLCPQTEHGATQHQVRTNSPFDIIYLQMPYAISRQDFIAVVLCAEITGPIMLESYRVIADYSQSSKYELSLKMGDMVDIVEKSPNGEQEVKCDSIKNLFNLLLIILMQNINF